MWRALIDDLLALPDATIETVIDDRWFARTPSSSRVHAWPVTDVAETMVCWGSCLEDTDAVWIIAPECDGMLEGLVTALPVSRTVLNATSDAIRLCADKFTLAQHLERHHIATIPTVLETWIQPPCFDRESIVIKPRDGAGSQLLRVIDDPETWERTRQEYRTLSPVEAIRQPYLRGEPLSIAGWFHANGVQWFPVAKQVLDENFTYHGGAIPGTNRSGELAVQRLAVAAAATIPGLRGYIGFDVLFPLNTSFLNPVLVEINPRLTTSCLGIRRLCRGNWLASLITDPTKPLEWHTDREIKFTSHGVVSEVSFS